MCSNLGQTCNFPLELFSFIMFAPHLHLLVWGSCFWIGHPPDQMETLNAPQFLK